MSIFTRIASIFAAAPERPKAVPDDQVRAAPRDDAENRSAWLSIQENPDEILRSEAIPLSEYKNAQVKDPKLRSALRERRVAALRKPWEIVAASDDPADLAVRDFVEKVYLGLAVERLNSHLLKGLATGYAVAEILWTTRRVDGVLRIVPDKIPGRRAGRFVFDHEGKIRLLTRENLTEGTPLPERKFLVFTHDPEDDNPYGEAEVKFAYWFSWFKREAIDFWQRAGRKFGSPTVIAEYPNGFPEDQIAKLETFVRDVENFSGLAVPEGVKTRLLESDLAKAGSPSFEKLLEYIDSQIAQSVNGQTLTSQEGRSGTQALGTVHEGTKAELTACDCEEVMEVHNGQLIPWLVDWNFETGRYPRFVVNYEEKDQLTARAERDERLAKLGLPVAKKYFYETYGIPEPSPEDELLEPPSGSSPGAPDSPPASTDIPGDPSPGDPPDPDPSGTEPPEPEPSEPGPKNTPPEPPPPKPPRRSLTMTEVLEMTEFVRATEDRIGELGDLAMETPAFRDPLKELRASFEAALKKTATLAALGSWKAVPPDRLTSLLHRLMFVAGLDARAAVIREARAQGFRPGKKFALDGGSEFAFPVNILTLANEEAIKFFASKIPLARSAFDALSAEAKRRAFSLAGDVSEQFTADVQKARLDAFEKGQSMEEFQKTVGDLYKEHGYEPMKPFYTETMYRNTAAEAYNAARWRQMNDPELGDFYWGYEYLNPRDDRSRPSHADLAGFVAPKDDPIWRTIWPPNGHRCRCRTRGISRAEASRRGIVSASPFPPRFEPDPGFSGNPAL